MEGELTQTEKNFANIIYLAGKTKEQVQEYLKISENEGTYKRVFIEMCVAIHGKMVKGVEVQVDQEIDMTFQAKKPHQMKDGEDPNYYFAEMFVPEVGLKVSGMINADEYEKYCEAAGDLTKFVGTIKLKNGYKGALGLAIVPGGLYSAVEMF